MPRSDSLNALYGLLKSTPYNCFMSRLYNAADLYEGYRISEPKSYSDCYDGAVYRHFTATGIGHEADELEQVARVVHDNSISRALRTFLHYIPKRDVIGIMGGHGLARTAPEYRDVVFMSKRLTEGGALMISGGGPGAMEATHLGAWMAGRSDEDTLNAIEILSQAPTFSDKAWLDTQFEVMGRWPQEQYKSLGLPTWTYGHEPPTPLATHIAKFFDNSIREDAILSIAYGGLVYVPGSAGTLQEVFQEAVQNHYLSLGLSSPMVFYGSRFWTDEVPIYPLLTDLTKRGVYKNLLLHLYDSVPQVVACLEDFRAHQEAGF